jgi:uncharacterized repeat protein (TIGR01451 family)
VRARIATAVALVVFLVLAGTGVASAFWNTTASTNGAVAVASPSTTNCVSPTRLVNGSFESPNIAPSAYSQLAPGLVPGWAVLNDNVVEIWRTQGGNIAVTGAQLAELNGNAPGTLYQDVVTVPGQTLRWSVQHRGREGTDAMAVAINAPGAALVQQAQFSDPLGAWVLRTGAYVVPAGQTTTRISLTPISTYQNAASIGNLIDDVTFGSGPCLQVSTAITNVTTGGTVYRAGDVVQYTSTITNAGGAPATPATFAAVVPTNVTYQAGSLVVDGTARTDTLADDVANYVAGTSTVAARIGFGATATVGGVVSTEQSVTVSFRGTIAAAAAGTNLSFTASAAYADLFAPDWPLSATSAALITTVPAVNADISVVTLASPTLAASSTRSWTFRVTNNGPYTGSNITLSVAYPIAPASPLTGVTVNYTTTDAGGTTNNCTGATSPRTCSLGTIPSGEGRTITLTGTLPGTLVNTYPVTVTTAPIGTTTADLGAGNNTATNNGILPDTTAPTAPTGLAASATSDVGTTLSWTASTDAVGVTGYRITRNGTVVTNTGSTATSYSVTGLTAGQPYWFWVQALDAAGNVSTASTGVGVITSFGSGNWLVRNTPYSNRCLATSSDNNDAALRTSTCNSSNDDWLWTFIADSGRYRVQPEDGTTRRWDLASATPAANVLLEVSSDDVTAARTLWTPTVVWDSTLNASYIAFKSDTTNFCINVGATGNNVQSTLQTCSTTVTNQRFLLTAVP